MKFISYSNYALNKRTQTAIVCFSASGTATEITESDIPDFTFWKEFSDSDYRERELHEKRTSREDIPLELLESHTEASVESPEDILTRTEEKLLSPPDMRSMENALYILNRCLTPTQLRRFLATHYEGKSSYMIAAHDGVDHKSVLESLAAAEKKIKNFLGRP